MTELIDAYLDALQPRLRGTPRDIRRMLRETEDHLTDAVSAGVDGGLTPADAQHKAIAQFGRVDDIARRFNGSSPRPRIRAGRLAEQGVALGGVALVAVGLSGVVAAAMTGIAGSSFVFADAPGRTYAASDCRHWLALHPDAHSCARAALAENLSDGLFQRFAAGIVGLVVLTWWMQRMQTRARSFWSLLSTPLVSIVAATAFGAAGLVLLALGIDAARVDAGNGAGQWFSAAGVSLLAAGLFAVPALRWLAEIPVLIGRDPAVTS